MLSADFEKLYESVRERAVAAVQAIGVSRDIAEDAVQTAALYFLERLDTHDYITASLFIQRAVQRGKDARAPRGVRHRSGRPAVEVPVGGSNELMRTENAVHRFRSGVDSGQRTKPHADADAQANQTR